MAMDKVRAAARRIKRLHERFANCFGRKHSQAYLRGLMLAEGPKNVEGIALQFASSLDEKLVGQNEVLALQGFVTHSPWQPNDVQHEIWAVFAEELLPSVSRWPRLASSSAARKVWASNVSVAAGRVRLKTTKWSSFSSA